MLQIHGKLWNIYFKETVKTLISEIKRIGISREAIEVNEDFPDPNDAIFFEVAMAEKEIEQDSFLVTGNTKHFPQDPIVTTPAQFVNIIKLYKNGIQNSNEIDT